MSHESMTNTPGLQNIADHGTIAHWSQKIFKVDKKNMIICIKICGKGVKVIH